MKVLTYRGQVVLADNREDLYSIIRDEEIVSLLRDYDEEGEALTSSLQSENEGLMRLVMHLIKEQGTISPETKLLMQAVTNGCYMNCEGCRLRELCDAIPREPAPKVEPVPKMESGYTPPRSPLSSIRSWDKLARLVGMNIGDLRAKYRTLKEAKVALAGQVQAATYTVDDNDELPF